MKTTGPGSSKVNALLICIFSIAACPILFA
jgi:hypothetical protein